MEEVKLVVATPDVTLTKMLTYGSRLVEVRANDKAEGLSIFYEAKFEFGEVPSVGEELLVAVLAGIHHSWLVPAPRTVEQGREPGAFAPITFEAVSAEPHGGNDPSRAEQHDTLHIDHAAIDGMTRLHVATTNESGSVNYARIVLSKGQVTSMIAALLAIYRRLEEN